MIVTIPLAPGLAPDPRVLQSLYDQDIMPHDIIDVERGFPYNYVKDDRRIMIENICLSRNECLKIMQESLDFCDCAAINDADERHLFKDNLARGQSLLMNNPEFGAVGLYDGRRDEKDADHIMLGCWIMHRRLLNHNLEFSFAWPGCECLDMCRKIRAVGLRVCYLDMEKRLENLKCS